MDWLKDLLGGAGSFISDAASGVGDFFSGLLSGGGELAEEGIGAAGDIFSGLDISDWFGPSNDLLSTSQEFGEVGADFFPDVTGAIEGLDLTPALAAGGGGASAAAIAGPATDWFPDLRGGISGLGKGEETKEWLDKVLTQMGDNPLGVAGLALGGANIARQFMMPDDPNKEALRELAASQRDMGNASRAQADALLAPLTTGAPLPAGAQAAIDARRKAAEAAARSQYASMGLSKSTMKDSAIQAAGQRALADEFAVRQGMARAGADIMGGASRALGGASSAYDRLLRTELAEDDAFQDAIAGLARSLGQFGRQPVYRPRA